MTKASHRIVFKYTMLKLHMGWSNVLGFEEGSNVLQEKDLGSKVALIYFPVAVVSE